MNAYWRAANYLSAGQLYLLDNPLLKKPLTMEQIKKKIVGHWGTVPGQNFVYVIGITSSCFAPFVELDFEDADVIFEDNFFHITDTVEKTIRIKKTDIRSGSFTDACDMLNRLTIRSLRTSD